MKYSYEFKKMCVDLYRQGEWPETPDGIEQKEFRHKIRKWFRIEEACGTKALEQKRQNKAWTAEEKYELVAKVLPGNSIRGTAFSAGISEGLLYQWINRYITMRLGRQIKSRREMQLYLLKLQQSFTNTKGDMV